MRQMRRSSADGSPRGTTRCADCGRAAAGSCAARAWAGRVGCRGGRSGSPPRRTPARARSASRGRARRRGGRSSRASSWGAPISQRVILLTVVVVRRVVARGAAGGGAGAASGATTAGGVNRGPARGWRLAASVVCGILPRALLHGRGAGARSRSRLARQEAVSRVLEVALERVLRILVTQQRFEHARCK
eukprot:scaffold25028_cov60-Phaeocystis_antarctica.AAC.1